MNTTLPPHLIEKLNNYEVVLFVGDALENDNDAVPPSRRLASALVNACGGHCPVCSDHGKCLKPDNCGVPLTQAAQLYEGEHDKHTLCTFVRDFLENAIDPNPTGMHCMIAELPVQVIVTTAYDDRLLKALAKAGRKTNHIVNDTSIAFGERESTGDPAIRNHF